MKHLLFILLVAVSLLVGCKDNITAPESIDNKVTVNIIFGNLGNITPIGYTFYSDTATVSFDCLNVLITNVHNNTRFMVQQNTIFIIKFCEITQHFSDSLHIFLYDTEKKSKTFVAVKDTTLVFGNLN
jgi:hypothetical protein